MGFDWKTGALAVAAIAIWVVFFSLGGGKMLGLGAVGDAKKVVARELRDPSSAQFRDVARHGKAVCGAVNGKNGFGAYAGFKRFVVEDGKAEIEPDREPPISPGLPSNADLFDLGWRISCGA